MRDIMSYFRADEVLPKELIETIQQYVDGTSVYIPRKAKQGWGSGTSARTFFCQRDQRIYEAYQKGVGIRELSQGFSLSEKSIQRILRKQRLAATAGDARGGRQS